MFIRFDMIHERDRRTDRHRMTAIAALMHSIARQKMSDEDELLLLSAAASAATIALTACIVKRRRKRVERFGCVRCSNGATKEGRTTHSWQSYTT